MKNALRILLVFLIFVCMTGCQPNVNQNEGTVSNDTPSSGDSPVDPTDATVPSDVSDTEILKVMNTYRFFVGDVLINEAQKWQSNYQDGSHGEGDAQLAVNELIAYDPETQKAYIVARTLKYESQHMVTVNDINGNFAGRSPVSASGELTECYGFGQSQEGVLEFRGLPVRMDQIETYFYTRPATHNSQWVAYRSTADTVRWSIERIGPPDYALDPQLQQLAILDSIANTKTYGNRQSAMYEATRRLWQVSGTVDYSYNKINNIQALDYIKAKLVALKVAKGYSSPPGLVTLGADYLKVWEALDQLARYSHQTLSAGQSILFMPVTYPPDMGQVNRDKLHEALAQISEIAKQNASFSPFPEGKGFLEDLQDRAVALKKAEENYVDLATANPADKEALEAGLSPFLAYLLRYEDTVQSLMALPENERTPNAQKEAIELLLAKGFTAEDTQALDMDSQVTIPEDYPSDVLPIPDNGRLVMAEGIESGGFNLTFIHESTEAKLTEKYDALLSKLPEYSMMKIQGMTIITATKAPWSISVTIGTNQLTDEGGIMIHLTVVPLD